MVGTVEGRAVELQIRPVRQGERAEPVMYVVKGLLPQQHRWGDVEFTWPMELFSYHLGFFPERKFSLASMHAELAARILKISTTLQNRSI